MTTVLNVSSSAPEKLFCASGRKPERVADTGTGTVPRCSEKKPVTARAADINSNRM